jgi:hypothetical protein
MIHRPPVALIIWRFDKTIESDVGYITRTIHGHPAVLPIMKFGSTPVDPAGPDCYQSEIKPCELT